MVIWYATFRGVVNFTILTDITLDPIKHPKCSPSRSNFLPLDSQCAPHHQRPCSLPPAFFLREGRFIRAVKISNTKLTFRFREEEEDKQEINKVETDKQDVEFPIDILDGQGRNLSDEYVESLTLCQPSIKSPEASYVPSWSR